MSQIIAAVGPGRLKEYIDEIFEPALVAIGYYTEQNAESWLDIDKFMRWVGHRAQKSAATPPATPNTSNRQPTRPSQSLPPSSPILPTSSPSPPHYPPRESHPVPDNPHSALPPLDPEDDNIPSANTLLSLAPGKRKRPVVPEPNPEESDSDSPVGTPAPAKLKRRRKGKDIGGNEKQEISKQFRVSEIRDIYELPSCWTVPRPDDGEDFAYRLDLTDDPRDWLDEKKQPLSMAAIIKSEDQDSWGAGSAGSLTKPTKVAALDGVPCQVAKHACQGVYHCSQLDMSLLEGHERYEPDEEDMRELFEAERTVNVRETSSVAIRAAAFYAEIHRSLCPHINANGERCKGAPVYRKLKAMNFDGKFGFIGCQFYRAGESRSHRFLTINRDVKEDLLRELLANNGVYKSDVNIDSESAKCARVLPPRNGGKGDRLCPYTHIDEDNQVIKGQIVHRKCPTIIRIFSPLDRSDRRAIVHFNGAHNHPKFPSRKLSRKGKDAYNDAITAAGVTGLTVLKCDSAESTSKIFGGQIPGAFDPALSNARIKRQLIQQFKTVQNPHGLGIEGVLYFQKQMQSLPHEKQYVWTIISDHGEEIVITMLPYLAERIHLAKASLHDNTYARVHGTWKEWEVVIWDHRVDHRVTIGRIYSQHESLEVFSKMWPGLFDTIGRITESGEVKFKFIDGEGLQAILLDGNKPQANALGVYLVGRNRPHLSGIHEKDPKLILLNILRTCIFHINRKFTAMAKHVPDEPMARIRSCPYLKTQAEVDEFIQSCKDSEYKTIRDWIADKLSIPWFFPSFNEFLSGIPEDDWYLTPGDTNLNESAHPYTNQHTGTNLSLLEAIQKAYKLDQEVEARLRAIDENCVLVNHLNTKPHRDRRNVARRTSNFRQAIQRSTARDKLENIDDRIRELREQKKELKSTSGVKKTKRNGEKNKDKLPDEEEFTGLSESTGDPAPSQSSPHRPTLRFADRADLLGLNSNHHIELDPSLEPSYIPLEGDLTNYLPYD
ncbi:hypothetical protein C8R43DRAFT_1152428 [Mycena crocata]|nr:hypothetical protein C8R43DRAFT_1152428 [Mycena crocata]